MSSVGKKLEIPEEVGACHPFWKYKVNPIDMRRKDPVINFIKENE